MIGAMVRLLVAIFLLLTLSWADFAQNSEVEVPSGVLQALAGSQREHCASLANRKGCAEDFKAHLAALEVRLSPTGKIGILVENRNVGFCGSAGCDLWLFIAVGGGSTFKQVWGKDGEVGSIKQVKALESVTNGFYDLRKVWADGKTHTDYQWTGTQYAAK